MKKDPHKKTTDQKTPEASTHPTEKNGRSGSQHSHQSQTNPAQACHPPKGHRHAEMRTPGTAQGREAPQDTEERDPIGVSEVDEDDILRSPTG